MKNLTLRRAGTILRRALLVCGILVAAVVLALQIPAAARWIAQATLERVVPGDSLSVELASARLGRPGAMGLTGLRIHRADGSTLVSLDSATVRYRVLPLFGQRLLIDSVRVVRPRVDVRREGEAWELAQLGGESPPADATRGASPWTIHIDRLGVTGGVATIRRDGESRGEVTGLDLTASDLSTEGGLSVVLDSLFLGATSPEMPGAVRLAAAGALKGGSLRVDTLTLESPSSTLEAAGTLPWPPAPYPLDLLRFRVHAPALALGDFAFLALDLNPAATVSLDAEALAEDDRRVRVSLDAGSSDGARIAVQGTATVDSVPTAAGTRPLVSAFRGSVTARDLDPSHLVTTAPAGDLNVEAAADLARRPGGHEGPDVWDGTVEIDWDASRLADASLAPGRVEATATEGTVEATVLGGAALPGGQLRANVDGRFSAAPWSDPPSYGGRAAIRLDGATPETLVAHLDGEGSGLAPDSLSGRWTVRIPTQSLYGVETAAEVDFRPRSGTGPWRIALTHGGGRAAGRGNLTLGPTLVVVADSLTVDSLDVAHLAGDTASSAVSLRGSGELRGVPGPEMTARGQLELLEGAWGGLPLPTGSATGAVEQGQARLSFEGRVGGGTLELTARATPFDSIPRLTLGEARFASIDPGQAAGTGSFPGSISGRLEGWIEGAAVGGANGRFTLALDSSRVRDQTISSATATVDIARGDATADLSLSLPDGGIEGRVTASTRGPGTRRVTVPGLTFRNVDLGPLAGDSARLATALNGSLEGALTLDTASAPVDGTVRMELGPSRINEGDIEEGSVTATLRAGALEGDAQVRTRAGTLSGTGSGVLEGTRLARGEFAVDFDLSELDRMLGLSQPASVAGRARVASTSGQTPGSWRVDAGLARGTFGTLDLDTLAVSGFLRSGAVDVDTLHVVANAIQAHGSGLLVLDPAVEGDPTFSLTAEVTDAQPLAELIGAEVLSVGTARIEARSERTAQGIRIAGEAEVNALLVDGLRVVGLTGDFVLLRTTSAAVDSAAGHLTVDQITNQGILDVAGMELDASYDGQELAVDASAEIDDTRSGELRAIIDPASGGRRLRIETFAFSVDEDDWTLTNPVDVALDDGITIGSTELIAEGQRIALGGRLHPTVPDTFRVQTDGFRIATVADLVGLPQLEGTLTTDVVSSGSLQEPRWDATIDAGLAGNGAGTGGSVDLQLGYADTRLETELTLRDAGGRPIIVQGYVPVDLDFTDSVSFAREVQGDANLQIQADSFDVGWFRRFLDPSTVSTLGGRLAVDATVTGQTGDPALSGQARITRGRISLPALGTEYEDIDVRLAMEGRRLQVVQGTVASDDATASVSGFVELESLGLGRFDVRAELDEFPLMATALAQARASGELRLGGTTQQPEVGGTVEVVSADIHLQGQSTERSVETIELSEADFEALRETFGYRPEDTEQDYGALYDALAADVSITIGRDSWLRQRNDPELAVQLTGELSIQKRPGEDPTVIGTVTPVESRSYLEQWGRRFQLASGEIVFQGPPLEPQVQLSATYEIPSRDNPGASEVVIELEVEGKPDSLRLILSSTPSMENSDIVSYIATGRPAAESLTSSGGGTSVSEVGVDLAAGQLTSAIEGLAAEAIGLDVVEIRREGPRDAVLVAGRYVSPRLYLGFQQPVSFGSSDGLARERLGQRVEIEYEAFRWLLLNLEGGQSDVEFFFRSRYGY